MQLPNDNNGNNGRHNTTIKPTDLYYNKTYRFRHSNLTKKGAFWTDLIFGVLTPLSTKCQLYHGDQIQWWKKLEYPERTTDHGQSTGKLYHLRLRVECTLFVFYKDGREPGIFDVF